MKIVNPDGTIALTKWIWKGSVYSLIAVSSTGFEIWDALDTVKSHKTGKCKNYQRKVLLTMDVEPIRPNEDE